MSFLMHVASTGLGNGVLSTPEPPDHMESLARSPVSAPDVEARLAESAGERGSLSAEVYETADSYYVTHEPPDPWVPMVKFAFHFAKKHLYMPEVRVSILRARRRSALALRSGLRLRA